MRTTGELTGSSQRAQSRLRRLASVAVAAALVATVLVTPVLPAPPAAAAPALPSGFVLQDLPTGMTPPSSSGPGDLLTDFAYLPDESIVAIGKYGKVTWISATGATRRLASLSVNAAGDLGLIGVAVAPDYATSHAIYTARALPSTAAGSGDSGLLRLSRWTVELDRGGDPAGLGAETTVLETSADSHWHSVGSVVADMDGSLWLSIGDSADWRIVDPLAFRALDRDDLHGKLLHLTPDGAGVPSNPFYDPAAPRTARSLVYALGFRSPLRFGLDSSTGLPVLGDVGSSTYEEVDLVRPGYSYGWPCWEANAPTPGWKDAPECVGVTTTKPVWAYPHNGSGSAVTGGLVYTGKNYPSGYQGRYFFGDYVDKVIWTMSFDGTATVTRPPESAGFATDIGQPVSFRSAPSSGDLVYADISSATIRRLVYAPGNTAPKAVLSSTADPDTRTVTFDTGGSSDPNGDPLVFAWDFGDGTTGTGATVQHTYAAQPDEFTVRLTATDPLGASSSTTATIYPGNHPPSLDVTWPDLAATYAVGDLVKAAATASDSEDGPLTVTWSSRVAHCYTLTDCHDHYGAVRSGPTFELAFEGHGGDSQLWITATTTDSLGATTSREFRAQPRQRRVTIDSTWPAGFTLGDGSGSSGLFTAGMALSVVAPARGFDDVSEFDHWGDGSTDRTLLITVPDADVTLEATYLTPIDRRLATDSAFRNRMGASVTVEQGDTSQRARQFMGGRVYWTPTTGAHFVAGGIMNGYIARGGPGWAGVPVTDELKTASGIGRYSHFARGYSYFWTSTTGAHWVNGAIRSLWAGMGWERSRLGYPTSDLAATSGRTGYVTNFQGGSIFWSGSTGAHWIVGGIRSKYLQAGAERSVLRYPTTNMLTTASGLGRYQHFQGGSIFWSSGTGAHPLSGAIRTTWAKLGWERSWLGYPTGDMYAVTVGARQGFQHGYLVWNRSTGKVSAYRY